MDRQVYDLTSQDFSGCPVWFFPMDESVQDELTVRPVQSADVSTRDMQLIVRTQFRDEKGKLYDGYVYWSQPQAVEYLKPLLWAGNVCITFWNGIHAPDDEYLKTVRQVLGSGMIEYESVAALGLTSLKGTLEGIYHLGATGAEIVCVKI